MTAKLKNIIILFISIFFIYSCDTIDDILGIPDDSNDNETINISSGLLAYYTFDDGTANDITENGLNGVLNNSPSFTSESVNGKGKAIFLNSQKEQYINIPYSPFAELESYSFSFWTKDFGYGSFLNTEKRFDFYYGEDGKFHINRNVSNYVDKYIFTYNASPLIDGKWHMITIVSNIDYQQLYVDGILVTSEKADVRTTSGASFKMIIDNHMKFDNLRLYNRVINAKEIKAIYDLEK